MNSESIGADISPPAGVTEEQSASAESIAALKEAERRMYAPLPKRRGEYTSRTLEDVYSRPGGHEKMRRTRKAARKARQKNRR